MDENKNSEGNALKKSGSLLKEYTTTIMKLIAGFFSPEAARPEETMRARYYVQMLGISLLLFIVTLMVSIWAGSWELPCLTGALLVIAILMVYKTEYDFQNHKFLFMYFNCVETVVTPASTKNGKPSYRYRFVNHVDGEEDIIMFIRQKKQKVEYDEGFMYFFCFNAEDCDKYGPCERSMTSMRPIQVR